jgi:predicted secreted protein
MTSPTISGNIPDVSVSGTVRAISTEQASLSSTLHPIQVGLTAGQNLAIDSNDIVSRNNGVASTISLNSTGGNVVLGSSSSAVSVPGSLSVTEGISGKRVQEIVNRTTSGSVSLSGSQAGRIHRTTHSSSTVTYTVDDTTLALGESVDILRGGAGEVAIAYSGSGLFVSESNKRRLALAYSAATILCVSTSPRIYHLVGSLKT